MKRPKGASTTHLCPQSIREDMLADLPRSREEALATGCTRFYTGKPCLRGHLAYRFTSSNRCALCSKQANTRRRHSDKAKRPALAKIDDLKFQRELRRLESGGD